VSVARALDFDVIVVGGGVAGATLAALLVNQGLCARGRVALVADRFARAPSQQADWDLRVFALSRASERILTAAGVWKTLPASRVSAYEAMCVWDAKGSPHGDGHVRFDCAEIGEPNLGFIVDGSVLQGSCVQAARDCGATLIEAPLMAISLGEDRITARLGDGRQISAQLIVGADGGESKVRRLLAIDTAGHTYLQDALAAHVQTSKPHGRTAWQRFLPGGPLAFLPLLDGRSSIVWSVARGEAERLRALEPEEFNTELTTASDGALGDCTLSAGPASFPLKLQYALHYVQSRAVLVGDAAHIVHPLAGQGLNLGLLDCAALTQVLSEARASTQFGDLRVLRRYERWRRSENLLAAAGLDGLERLFASPSGMAATFRKAGLSIMERAPPLKRRLARQALGLSGDVPRLAKADLF
jgi:2-polyprenylphenol 6-hydroxylase